MTRIQLTATALERLRPRLDALAQPFEYVVMDTTGRLRLDGREVSAELARPECGLLSNDLFFAAFQMDYIDALVRSPALEWVQSCGAGLDHPMFTRLARRSDIRLTTNHSQGVGIAEYVMWGVLGHFHSGAAQRVQPAEHSAHRWIRRRAREISGTRWLILGFGSIGQEVARRAKAFGAHVTGVRRRPEPSEFAHAVVGPEQILDTLSNTDVVVLCMPHTPETVNLVDATFLGAMKPTSMLINVGRGSAIDDAALLRSLDAGKPEHALLDVFRVEPLPDDHPFWSHPRITATAHTSAVTTGWDTRLDELIIDNIGRYLAGEPLRHEIPISKVLEGQTGA
jgi:phosphoglycerate dehydrogenase-like enzyme